MSTITTYTHALVMLVSLFFVSIDAAPGCMDNSYHADPCAPYDYKNYHYVDCDCPCERYAQLYNRGMCGGCHHYRIPRDSKLDAALDKMRPRSVTSASRIGTCNSKPVNKPVSRPLQR